MDTLNNGTNLASEVSIKVIQVPRTVFGCVLEPPNLGPPKGPIQSIYVQNGYPNEVINGVQKGPK